MLQQHAQLTISQAVPRNEMTLVGSFDSVEGLKSIEPIKRTASPELFNELDIGCSKASTSQLSRGVEFQKTICDASTTLVVQDDPSEKVGLNQEELKLRAEMDERLLRADLETVQSYGVGSHAYRTVNVCAFISLIYQTVSEISPIGCSTTQRNEKSDRFLVQELRC